MKSHIVSRLALYKERHQKPSPGVKKPPSSRAIRNITVNTYNNSDLLKQIEKNLIPALELVRISSERYAADLKAYRKSTVEYQSSLKEYNEKIENELKKEREDAEKKLLEKEKKLREDEERKKQEEEKKKEIMLKQEAARQEKLKESEQFIYSFARVQGEFHKNQATINDIKRSVKEPVLENTDLKKILNKHKRLINPKFGQLTNSRRQLMEISSKITQLVAECKPNPLAYSWILNFIAKSLVHQAELECRVKPDMAVPLAELTHVLGSQFAELIPDFLLPRLIKKCPLIIGFISGDRKEMGFKVKQEEKKDVYVERMDGILAYYAVLCKLPNNNGVFIHYIWKMITRWANMDLKMIDSDLVLGSLVAVLECCGNELFMKFGRQTEKLLAVFLSGDFEKQFSSSVNWKRLSIIVEDRNSSGKFKSYPGLVND